MGRSRFPGKPFKFQSRRRVSVLLGTVFCEDVGDESPESDSVDTTEDNSQETEEDKTTATKKDTQEKSNIQSPKSEASKTTENMVFTADKTKPIKKTVTFGAVESCEDAYTPLKELPSKNQAPLASIIKKRSLKSETGYNSILKPAKLTDLSSKLSYDTNSFRSSLSAKPFSCLTGGRSSPPPFDKPSFSRRAHSSRLIKPNRKFIDEDDLKKLSFNDENSSRSSSPNENVENDLEESGGSWDSTSSESCSEDEKEENNEKPTSQLLCGKVLIREARLQLGIALSHSSEGPFSSFSAGSNASTVPSAPSLAVSATTTITCGVCGAVRFYKFVKQARKFGIYTCESCRKFISKILKKEKVSSDNGLQCLRGEGNCHVPPVVRSQHWKMARCANKARCPACWLKLCLKAFQMPQTVRDSLDALLPSYMSNEGALTDKTDQASPLRNSGKTDQSSVEGSCKKIVLSTNAKSEDCNQEEVSDDKEKDKDKSKEQSSKPVKLLDSKKMNTIQLISSRKKRLTKVKTKRKDKTESETLEDSIRQKMEIKGPRVKHVCRSASIVLGQPVATFPENDENKHDKTDECSSDDSPKLQVIEQQDEPTDEVMKETPASVMEVEIKQEVKEEESEFEVKRRKIEPVKLPEIEEQPIIVPRKSSVKQPLAAHNTNIREPPTKQNRSAISRPGCISVDYWRAYDLDEVSSVGFAITATAPFPVNAVCFLCASSGREQLIYCGVCCEAMHSWCTTGAGGIAARGEFARCPRCVICASCNRPAARARCRSCTRPYHAACLRTRADWPQLCAACLKCKSCDSPKVRKFVGSLPFCAACFRLRQKGNYCPLCQGCYQDNDFDSKMMECGLCSRWVHAACERLSGEAYQLLSILPPSEEYTCRVCTPSRPRWRSLLAVYLKERLRAFLKALADNKNACALLKLTPHKPPPSKSLLPSQAVAVRRLSFREEQANKAEESTSASVYRAYGHRVINLQEPLMQNKEICFYDVETEFENTCVQVNDNNPNPDSLRHVMMDVDKYEAISDDDSVDEQDLSELKSPLESPSLLDIKKKVNADEYTSLQQFNRDMKEIIARTLSKDLSEIYKKVFAEIFPWFDIETNAVKPELEIDLDTTSDDDCKEVDNLQIVFNEKKNSVDHNVPKFELNNSFETNEGELYGFEPKTDTRVCVLCKVIGEGDPVMEGRLLYCGQNDWIHANCALWSAEVFEEIDGSLQNVMSAISRGKMIKCASCDAKGASVGCCAKNCSETFHYSCARRSGCAFLDDKRVFCPVHCKDLSKQNLQNEYDFLLQRPIYVELDRKKKRYGEISKIQVLLGSMTLTSLGKIVPCVSDHDDYLIPVDFVCTRLFWSTKVPWKLVRYTIRTKLVISEPKPGFDTGVNITLDHAGKPLVVERIMAEINAWHKSLDMGISTLRLLQKNNSPVKLSVSLEELAVKQVMDYLLDCICRQEQDEDEPQNTADILPPELKDAIFEDLNHDLLDGISMQDIFPKLMSYEEILGSDSKLGNQREESPDFEDLLTTRTTLATREYKKNPLKTRNTQKLDSSLLTSTIKRCKLGIRTSTITSKSNQPLAVNNAPNSSDDLDKSIKSEYSDINISRSETSGTNITHNETSKRDDNRSSDKNEYYTQVIDFYTKIHCSPISQLDGACDDSGSESSSRAESPIPQLDGAGEMSNNDLNKPQTNQFYYRTAGDNSYTVTIAGGSMTTLQPDLVIRGPDETTVRCDRCQCTYRNKEMYDRHIPSCDMVSTSESESENPKSPQERTLTTLQNAFPNFAQPIVIGQTEQPKTETITTRRSSTNTRQITINGTIVETGSNTTENVNFLAEHVKGTVIYDKNNQMINSSQIVVSPQLPLVPPKSSTPSQKMVTQQILSPSGNILPYNICIKPGTSIANTSEIPQFFSTPAGIQAVITSNGGQILTIPANQQSMIQGKNVQNCQLGSTSITLPMNSLQGIPTGSIIQNIQPMIQGNPTIVVPALTTQNRSQLILPHNNQKSPKKQSQVQPKPIFQAGRGRGRTVSKTQPAVKRQAKLEKTYQTLNSSVNGNAVIQLQPNNQTGQPSIIVQPVGNQNIMSAYVDALSQQQNQNMQYIATIAPQGDFKSTPTQFISTQGGIMPQTFQIQQTESGSLVAVPSGGIPILLSQGNVGILPQTLPTGTILPQGSLSSQGIITQGPNGPTILPQSALSTQNGNTILSQGLTSGNLATNATILSNSNMQPTGNIGNNQTALVSQPQALPQGTILPQFCNDQVILGSAPEFQMVTDSSGRMYLTAAQPVYYGLETIVQNTVMSSQQFVSTAVQGVLAQNSSFSATTTQVFQASKIEPIVEMPTGYVVVNADQSSQSKSSVSLHGIGDKSSNKQPNKCVQSGSDTRPITTPTSSSHQTLQRNNTGKSASPSGNQPSISSSQLQSLGLSLQSSMQSTQPIISTTVAPSIIKQRQPSHTIEIGVSQDNIPVLNVSTPMKSPTPWQNNFKQDSRIQTNQTSSTESFVSMPKLTISNGGIAVTPSNKPWHDISQPLNRIATSNCSIQQQNNVQASNNVKISCPGQSNVNNVIHISSGNISQFSPSMSNDNEFNPNKYSQNRPQSSNSSIFQNVNHTIYTTVSNNHDRPYPVMTIPLQENKHEANAKDQHQVGNIGFSCDPPSIMNETNRPSHSQSLHNVYSSSNFQITNSVPCYNNSNHRISTNDNQMHLTSSQNMLNVNQVCNQQQTMQCNSQSSQNRIQFENPSNSMHGNLTNQRSSHDNEILSQNAAHTGQVEQSRLQNQPNTNHLMNKSQAENNYHMEQQMANSTQHRLLIEEGNIHYHPNMSNNNHGRIESIHNPHQHIPGHVSNRQSVNCSANSQMHQINITNRTHDNNQSQVLTSHQNQNAECSGNLHQQHILNQNSTRSHNMENPIMNQQSSCSINRSDETQDIMGLHINHQNLDAINVGIQSMNVVNQIPNRSMDANVHMPSQSCGSNQNVALNSQHRLSGHNLNIIEPVIQLEMKKDVPSCAGNCVSTPPYSSQYENNCSNSPITHNMSMNNQLTINSNDRSTMLPSNMNLQNINSNSQMMQNQMYLMGHMNSGSSGNMLSCGLNSDFNSGISPIMETSSSMLNNINQINANSHLNIGHSNQMTMADVQRNEHNYNADSIANTNINNTLNSSQSNIMPSVQHLSDCAKVNNNVMCSDKISHNVPIPNQLGYIQLNSNANNRMNNITGNRGDIQNINPMLLPSQHNIRVMSSENMNQRSAINEGNLNNPRNENANVINVPIRAIPNSAPMNINVNSSNNTVNITVQNNLVDPKIMGKGSHIDYTVRNNAENNGNSMICVPLQNGTITLPSQHSISFPKAPVNPTRPTNRVLPLHRNQGKSTPQPKPNAPPRQIHATEVLPSQDMPDLSMKEESLDSDLNKAIEKSKCMAEVENIRRKQEAIELSEKASSQMETSLPSLEDNFEVISSVNRNESTISIKQPTSQSAAASRTLFIEKNFDIIANSASSLQKTVKRPHDIDKKPLVSAFVRKSSMKNKENKYHRPPVQQKDDGPKLIYEISSEDGFSYSSSSLADAWSKVLESVVNARKQVGTSATMTALNMTLAPTHLLGLHNNSIKYLLQQLPGANGCSKYRTRHGLPPVSRQELVESVLRESPCGAARCCPVVKPPPRDMFSWLASPFRAPTPTPASLPHEADMSSRRSATLPLAMRFRNLKETCKTSLGVYRSHIHGRGLFCKRDIDEGEMVIEYAGEVIRAALADRREARYERRGAGGCYMFRVDNRLVVDATLRGNAARFINHSCDPNCYSKVVDIHGHKHIVIFALRRIARGEELTYDYKFPFEEDKIPCTCGAKKCKKYLN